MLVASVPPYTPEQAALRADLTAVLERETPGRLALMVYGSVARGTATASSDLDVLELVSSGPTAYRVGRANVTQYLPVHLRQMAEVGSLFVLHLRVDGEIVSDSKGILTRALAAYSQPANYKPVWRQIELAAVALDAQAADLALHLSALARMGIYLLRTATYVRCIELGQPTFDVHEAAQVVGQPGLVDALQLRRRSSFRREDIALLREQIATLTGGVNTNPLGSIEAYAVSVSNRSDMASLFGSVLGGFDGVDYSTLSLPPL